jgi:hypothetical protein
MLLNMIMIVSDEYGRKCLCSILRYQYRSNLTVENTENLGIAGCGGT